MKRKRGRPPKGRALIEKLAGSAQAREKLELIVGTMTGELTVEEACAKLGVSAARFHQVRDEGLGGAMENLEPKPVGRPRVEETEEARRIRELQARVDRLELELHAADVRTMIALTMPNLLKDHGGKKN